MTDNVFSALDLLILPAKTVDGMRWYAAAAAIEALQLDDGRLVAISPGDITTGDHATALISEAAFLRLALDAKVEAALALRKWLCMQVLPAIWVSTSYFMGEEQAMRAHVEGVIDIAEWKLEHAARYVIPLIRKNKYYFHGMENVGLDKGTPEQFLEARTAAFERKRAELGALGFELP